MKKILFPTDFSFESEKAFAFAQLIATHFDAELLVLHTYLPSYVDPSIPIDIASNLQNELIDSLKNQLDEVVLAAKVKGVKVSGKLVYSDIKNGVLETVREENCEMVVIGKTDDNGFFYKLVGSNAAHIANSAKVPVLMVPAKVENVRLEKFLYGTQLEEDELEQLAQLSKFTDSLNASFCLGHIIVENELNIESDEQLLYEIKEAFSGILIHTIDAQNVTTGLLELAHAHHCDALVVSTHHRNFFTQLLDPSKSEHLINHSDLPVLIYHFD